VTREDCLGPIGLRQFDGNAPDGASGYRNSDAAAELSLITNGIRLVLFDNELVHCQKIDILMEVFMIILE
jgi:hypothetical protein